MIDPTKHPINDNSAAFAMMVRHRIEPRFLSDEKKIEPDRVVIDNVPGIVELCGNDPYAATRIAIVRAAAAMWKES